MKRWLVFIAVLGLALWLTACAAPEGAPAPVYQEVTVEAVDIAYQPARLEVTAGQPVRLTLINSGALEHDFSIQRIAVEAVRDSNAGGHTDHAGATGDLHTSAPPGGRSELVFTPTEAGTYQFYCTVAGHKDAGAVGTLVVR